MRGNGKETTGLKNPKAGNVGHFNTSESCHKDGGIRGFGVGLSRAAISGQIRSMSARPVPEMR